MNPTARNTHSIHFYLVPLALLFFGVWLYGHIAQGIFASLQFDGFIANGPFQLFNPLRRIAAGQTAGVDFHFFHGLGVPFLHYPLFAIFGKNIFASELSRNFTTLILFLVSLFTFAFIATERSLTKTLYFAVSLICLLELLSFHKIDGFGLVMATPGNSLLGARSAFPIFAFAILLSRLAPLPKAMLAGICFGLAFFCGTEHGMVLIATFCGLVTITITLQFIRTRTFNTKLVPVNFQMLLLALCTCGATIVLAFGVSTRFRGIRAALRYALVEVPADQFWYFGAPPNQYAGSLLDFFTLPWKGIAIFLAALFLLGYFFVYLYKTAQQPLSNFAFSTGHMLCYGIASCASCLGMLEEGYLTPLVRIFCLVLLMWAFKYGAAFIANITERAGSKPVMGVCVLALLPFAVVGFLAYVRTPAIFSAQQFSFQPELSKPWQTHLATIEKEWQKTFPAPQPVKLWSTYAGLLEFRKNIFLPREDYIIHALGKEKRDLYLATFNQQQPDVVQTIRRSYFNQHTNNHDYEQWLRNTTWDFYETLLNNYETFVQTDRSLFWKRKIAPWQAINQNYQELSVTPQQNEFTIPLTPELNNSDFLIVKISYQTRNPWKKLPIFGGLPRYFVHFENTARDLPVSLSPHEQEIRFPVICIKGAAPKLTIATHSLLPGAGIKIQHIAVKPYQLTPAQQLFLAD